MLIIKEPVTLHLDYHIITSVPYFPLETTLYAIFIIQSSFSNSTIIRNLSWWEVED